MKPLKLFFTAILALLFNAITGGLIAAAVGLPAVVGMIGMNLAATLPLPQGVAMAGVLKEIWTGELLKAFREAPGWLSEIADRSELVENDVIHMSKVGADPTVLVNNTSYPIAIAQRTDTDVAIALDKYDTTNTAVTDDELYAITYDKIASVVEQHKEVLIEVTAARAAHNLAPATSAAGTPLVLTTGASNGAANARKRMVPTDLVTMKKHFDDLKIPKANRIAVLCNDHIQDLLLLNENFAKQYMDAREGTILRLHGFKIYEFTDMPIYSVVSTVLTKKAFGAAAVGATDQAASLFFYSPRAFKASGSTNMYMSEASKDPANRRTVVGFRQHFVCLQKEAKGFGCVVSATV